MNVVIVHGLYSNPQGNWFQWLKEELEKEGHSVHVPKFPTPVNQSLERWMKGMAKYKERIQSQAVLIGHSLGAAFLLSFLEKNRASASFLVGGFHRPLGLDLDRLNASFIEKEFDWDAIRAHCPKRFMFSSDDDPYISLEVTKELQKKLGAGLIIVKSGKHLNAEAGYTEFTLLKEMVLREMI